MNQALELKIIKSLACIPLKPKQQTSKTKLGKYDKYDEVVGTAIKINKKHDFSREETLFILGIDFLRQVEPMVITYFALTRDAFKELAKKNMLCVPQEEELIFRERLATFGYTYHTIER